MPTPNIRNRLGSTEPSLPTDPHEVLNRAGVPGMEQVFIIGYGARQVTIHSQQVRALKLIWALDREKPLEGECIVVIGGGIAGITAASSATADRTGHDADSNDCKESAPGTAAGGGSE